MFKNILVPLDGSELSEHSLKYAEELAGTFNSDVQLVYVCEPEESEYRHMHELYIQKIAEKVRRNIKSNITEETNSTVKVNTEVLDGDPAEEIIEFADKSDISIIIMVSHGRSGLVPWSIGSTANRVIHRTTKPVLMVRANTDDTELKKGELFSKILVPLDGSEDGEAALFYIKELTSKIKAEVTLLQIVTPGKHVHTLGGLDYINFPEPEMEHFLADARQYLENASKHLIDTKAIFNYKVITGDAAQSIIKYADETNTRLVAISTHGRSGIKRWISGSVTYKVLQAGNTPILVVRTPSEAET
jgi:nucleotide-binding universal stress UspA family protein